jgi:hypothetical protein
LNWPDRLKRKRLAYLRTLCDEGGKPHQEATIMLRDLKRFCGINKGGIVVSPVTRNVDSHATVYRAGMRDVYLRIAGMINLDETDISENSHAGSSDDT